MKGEKNNLLAFFYRQAALALSLPYLLIVYLRNFLYRHHYFRQEKVTVPVISVGNLSLGGTGKTPCIEMIARYFRQQDKIVTILSRGYGSKKGYNDEAMVLEWNLPDVPHLQGKNRAELAKIAIEELESELILLDDGFQHQALYRDLDIVLIDAMESKSLRRIFPRGSLREPYSSLRRANIVIFTRYPLPETGAYHELSLWENQLQKRFPHLLILQSRHDPVQLLNAREETTNLEILKNRPIVLVSGIGNPEGFKQTIEQLGGKIVTEYIYADHYNYSRGDIEFLENEANRWPENTLLVTTQKDLVKIQLSELGKIPIWALCIELVLLGKNEEWYSRLDQVITTR